MNAKCHLIVISRRCLVIHDVAFAGQLLHIPAYFDVKSKNQGTPLGLILDFNDFCILSRVLDTVPRFIGTSMGCYLSYKSTALASKSAHDSNYQPATDA